jgi:surface protein
MSSGPTIITNKNIKYLVKTYINNPKDLPRDLRRDYIREWDVSRVTDMSELFMDYGNFDEPLDDWDVSNVTDMTNMFAGCHKFNQPLNKWKVSKVEKMGYMFAGCNVFNQPLDKWDVSNVEDMGLMFHSCYKFNQDLSSWDVYNVKDMIRMFGSCYKLKIKPEWILNPKTDTEYMFRGTDLEDEEFERSNIDIRELDKDVKNTIIALSNRRTKNNKNAPLIPDLTRNVLSFIDDKKITEISKALEKEPFESIQKRLVKLSRPKKSKQSKKSRKTPPGGGYAGGRRRKTQKRNNGL